MHPTGQRGLHEAGGTQTFQDGGGGWGRGHEVKEAPSLSEGVPKDCRGRISGKMDSKGLRAITRAKGLPLGERSPITPRSATRLAGAQVQNSAHIHPKGLRYIAVLQNAHSMSEKT